MEMMVDLTFLDLVVVHLDLGKEIHKEDAESMDIDSLEEIDFGFGCY